MTEMIGSQTLCAMTLIAAQLMLDLMLKQSRIGEQY